MDITALCVRPVLLTRLEKRASLLANEVKPGKNPFHTGDVKTPTSSDIRVAMARPIS